MLCRVSEMPSLARDVQLWLEANPMSQRKPTGRAKARTTGVVAANPHEGSRSEILADYLFSGWGTVTPVRRSDDFGVDLYCTLTDRIGRRAFVRDYFTVQVKSANDPWEFNGADSIRWLLEYPQPLFLACVDKHAGSLRVYHTMPRFLVRVLPPMQDRLVLIPGTGDVGTFVKWEDGIEFSLSAPILEIGLGDFLDASLMASRQAVFRSWVQHDRANCDLARQGLLRFRVPREYAVNEIPDQGFVEIGNAAPLQSEILRSVLTAAEPAECVGGQLGQNGDRKASLFAALLVDHLRRTYPDVFDGQPRWADRLPADLGRIVCGGLNAVDERSDEPGHRYKSLDIVLSALLEHPLVSAFVGSAATQHTPTSGCAVSSSRGS